MTIQIGEPASPTFAQPLALLSDCHRRVERFLNVFQVVGRQVTGRALNDREREALTTALRYFREAAPRHTADEEESLFPRLRRATHPLAVAAMYRLAALESDHAAAAPRHEIIETLGQQWLRDGRLEARAQALFCRMADALVEMYAHHIALEDQEVFPLAARILKPAELRAVGSEMARRRGLTSPQPERPHPANPNPISHGFQPSLQTD